MKRKIYFLIMAFSTILLLNRCTRDSVLAPAVEEKVINEALLWTPDQGMSAFLSPEFMANAIPEDIEFIDRILKNPKAEDLGPRGVETHVPAGSHNALAAAIAAAGVDDVIVIDAGNHTESGTVVINKKVKIYGEKGANLIFSNVPFALANPSPAFYIHGNAQGSVLKGLHITSTDPFPGVCIFIDSTQKIKILQSQFEQWHTTIISYASDRVILTQNKIKANTGWLTGALPDAYGIAFSDGDHCEAVMNEVSGGLFGIWTGGTKGNVFSNLTTECLYGVILCKVPNGAFTIFNRTLFTQSTTVNWLVKYNQSNSNFAAGYLVIDGAHGNWLQHNCAEGNAAYAFELTGDTYRFGFLTPKSFNNTLIAYPNLTVKDCGENNKVIGGIWINTATDPCN